MHRYGWIVLLAVVVGCKDDDGDTDRPAPVIDTDVRVIGGSLEACAGPHIGAYRGDERGGLSVELSADGLMEWTFLTPSGPFQLVARVTEDGAVVGDSDEVVVLGAYEVDGCTAQGTWILPDYAAFDGTWGLGRG